MTIRLKVRGFRGVDRADIDIDPGSITLLAGQNHQGKSSVCQSLAAAVCNVPIPFYGAARPDKPVLTKTQAKGMVRGGMDKGYVELYDGEERQAQVMWPGCTVHSTEKYACSKVAAGLLNPLEFDDALRQKFFAGLLESDPVKEDIEAAFNDAKVTVENFHSRLEVDGWDVLHTTFKETGARLKGQWEAFSGSKYGSTKAADWKPEGWRDELENYSLENIGTELAVAQRNLEGALGALAVGEADIERLTKAAGVEAQEAGVVATCKDRIEFALNTRIKAADRLKGIEVPEEHACPSCGTLLDATRAAGGVLVLKLSELRKADIDRAREEKAAAVLAHANAEELVTAAQKALNEAVARLAAVQGSAVQLQAAKGKRGTQEAVDVARDYLRGVEADRERIKALLECRRIAGEVVTNQKIIDILAPDGLRRQKLVQKLAVFNRDHLAKLCALAEFQQVTVDESLSVLHGGRPYYLLSESEKYRVRAVLQTAVACVEGSPLVIFDGADILDSDGRNGLVVMLAGTIGANSTLQSAVVAMTIRAEEDAPDFAAAGLGRTYWLDAGIARELTHAEAA